MKDTRYRLNQQSRNESTKLKIERRRRNREPQSGFHSGFCVLRKQKTNEIPRIPATTIWAFLIVR